MYIQITALEKNGGTILGGALKLFRDRKKNPGPPRDPSLPPKPKGQTVGSFTGGLRMLPDAIARKMESKLRSDNKPSILWLQIFWCSFGQNVLHTWCFACLAFCLLASVGSSRTGIIVKHLWCSCGQTPCKLGVFLVLNCVLHFVCWPLLVPETPKT